MCLMAERGVVQRLDTEVREVLAAAEIPLASRYNFLAGCGLSPQDYYLVGRRALYHCVDGVPILLGAFLARRYGLAWRLFIAGGLTFIAAQVFHLPFNFLLTQAFKTGILPSPPAQWHLLFNATVLGLSAALFEEIAR
jgi:hypothetical protein